MVQQMQQQRPKDHLCHQCSDYLVDPVNPTQPYCSKAMRPLQYVDYCAKPKAQQPTEDDEYWYLAFLDWFAQNYRDPVCGAFVICYHELEQEWYKYNVLKGVYESCKQDVIHQIINDWADHAGIKTTNQLVSHAILRLRCKVMTSVEWDSDRTIEHVQNGLLNLVTLECKAHTPLYFSKHQIDRTFRPPAPGTEWAARTILKTITDLPRNGDRLRQFLLLILHRDYTQELFYIAYGKAGSGKSTGLQIASKLYGRNYTSATPLFKLGNRFGLKESHDKRINVNPDMACIKLKPEAIAIIKTLTGGEEGSDGRVEVEMKGKDSFTVQIQCFHMFGINQLPQFAEEVMGEIDSIMRRACLVDYTDVKIPIPCPAFKELVADPEFLDDLYWILLHMPVEKIKLPDDQTFKNTNRQEWSLNANPLAGILRELYQYAKGKAIPCKTVIDETKEACENEGLLIGSQVQQQITFCLQDMRIFRDNGRGLKANYLNIERLTEEADTTSSLDTILNERKKR